ncbi:MAG: hypothetical protein ACI8W3_000872 [Myxococcota bacterium]
MSSKHTSHPLTSAHRKTVALVVELVCPPYPDLTTEERTEVTATAAAFVVSQIEAMPTFLFFPFALAITGFQWLAALRYGRGFDKLDSTRKVSYLAVWSGSPIGPFRDFVKLIRSCALLAYFDHPVVTKNLPAMHADREVHGVADLT